jgi:hypothetical protein
MIMQRGPSQLPCQRKLHVVNNVKHFEIVEYIRIHGGGVMKGASL